MEAEGVVVGGEWEGIGWCSLEGEGKRARGRHKVFSCVGWECGLGCGGGLTGSLESPGKDPRGPLLAAA